MKLHPVEAELFHADGQTDRQTYLMKLIVALRNSATAPQIELLAISVSA